MSDSFFATKTRTQYALFLHAARASILRYKEDCERLLDRSTISRLASHKSHWIQCLGAKNEPVRENRETVNLSVNSNTTKLASERDFLEKTSLAKGLESRIYKFANAERGIGASYNRLGPALAARPAHHLRLS